MVGGSHGDQGRPIAAHKDTFSMLACACPNSHHIENLYMSFWCILSRMIDSSEIFLAQFAFDKICSLQLGHGRSWGVPTLDCFAGHAKGQHQVDRFYSKFYCPGAVAVSAMYQNWAVDACLLGRLPLLWVFPPFELVGQVIGKLLLEQTDAILIVPRFRRYWQVLLRSLPIIAQHELKYHNRLYSIGSRAPVNMKSIANKPIIQFMAYRISFA